MPNQPMDQNNKAADFLGQMYLEYIGKNVNCHMIGRVTAYNPDRGRCDVQPLPLTSKGNKRAPLVEVIVPANISQQIAVAKAIEVNLTTIRVGAIVTVGFFDRDIENFKDGNSYNLKTKRMHSMQDSFVEAVII